MVLIPAGSFEMGDHFNEGGEGERPVHTVTLDEFYIDVTEVTNGQYQNFMQQTGHRQHRHWNSTKHGQPNQPVIGVNWYDAMAYAKWAGKRLPTEAEWEYAARGGLRGKRYPWGDDESLARDYANYGGTGGKDKWDETTAPVGSFEANGYGLYDIAGNAGEWCLDAWDEEYYSKSPTVNPLASIPAGHDSTEALTNNYESVWYNRVLRGGYWYLGEPSDLRVSIRGTDVPSTSDSLTFGFRCAADLP